MLTTAKSGCTIYTGILYLHNGFVLSKKTVVRAVVSSKSLNSKETEYIAEDFKAEMTHPLFGVT